LPYSNRGVAIVTAVAAVALGSDLGTTTACNRPASTLKQIVPAKKDRAVA
jgi:hypothetical protein